MTNSGLIAGYDPGGNDRHGVACLTIANDVPTSIAFETVRNARSAIDWFLDHGTLIAIGIDTLTILSTGDSGWRPADLWLREKYPIAKNSVVNPNYLQGSMALSGLAIAHEMRNANPKITVVETHPKVLYYQQTGRRYRYSDDQQVMNRELGCWLTIPVNTQTDHEWDAVVSTLAAFQWVMKRWTRDLHALPTRDGESLVSLVGETQFCWPT